MSVERFPPNGIPGSLPDHLSPGLRAIFVGINPSLRSAETGHHYAGPNNRFWDLMASSGLIPVPLTYHQDSELLEYGLGLTNIVPRVTRSSSELSREDFRKGGLRLAERLEHLRPATLVLVGITVYRALAFHFGEKSSVKVACGWQRHRLSRIPIYVVPNPSGRNAHYPYATMLSFWRGLAKDLDGDSGGPTRGSADSGSR